MNRCAPSISLASVRVVKPSRVPAKSAARSWSIPAGSFFRQRRCKRIQNARNDIAAGLKKGNATPFNRRRHHHHGGDHEGRDECNSACAAQET